MSGEASTELEAMHKEDGSWHPCRVSLRPSITTITTCDVIVDFENLCKQDIISSKEEALERLRYSSTLLQEGECASIYEGELVLAMNKFHSQNLFFDAVVEKVLRVRHSKRVFCRCTFQVKWIHSRWNWDVMTLASSAIKKLSTKSINSHPVIVEFLDSSTPASSLQVQSDVLFSEEIKDEINIRGLLESQLKEIGTITDGVKCSESPEFVTIIKDESRIDPLVIYNDLKGYNGVQRKVQFVEFEKNSAERPFLSPLAARAALASLVHELPQKTDSVVSELPFISSSNTIDSPSDNENCSFKESSVSVHGSLRKQRANKEINNMPTRVTHGSIRKKSKSNLDSSNVIQNLKMTTPKNITSKCSSVAMRQTRSMRQKVVQKLFDEKEKIFSKNHQSPKIEFEGLKHKHKAHEYSRKEKSDTSPTDYGTCTEKDGWSGSSTCDEMSQDNISNNGKKAAEQKNIQSSEPKVQLFHRPRTRSQR